MLQNAQKGKLIRDGLRVVIAGKPNVGKSSLLNALLGQERAIVTDIPGTTRDVIEEYINLNGIPLKIVDTAGIRETDNLVEQIGVDRARQFVQNADSFPFCAFCSTEVIFSRMREARLINCSAVSCSVSSSEKN